MKVFSEGPNGEDPKLIGRCDDLSSVRGTERNLYLTNWVSYDRTVDLSQRAFGTDKDGKMLLALIAVLVQRLGGGVVIDSIESVSLSHMCDKLVITQMRDPFAVKLVVED